MTPAELDKHCARIAYDARLQREREARKEAARTSTHGQLKAEQRAMWEATGKGPRKRGKAEPTSRPAPSPTSAQCR